MTLIRVLTIVGVALLLSGQTNEGDDLDEAFGKDSIVISADRHACFFFEVYVATSRAQQMRGLMHVRYLPEFTGMIFVYRRAGIRSMWMKNTYIPLDMLFIRADGMVSSIETHTEPHSLESISAVEPVNYVLELNAGVTERLAIGTGSRVIFSNAG